MDANSRFKIWKVVVWLIIISEEQTSELEEHLDLCLDLL